MDWQPIETAPKGDEGEQPGILVWCPGNRCAYMVAWDWDSDQWEFFGPDGSIMLNEEPTHWAPHPEPPK